MPQTFSHLPLHGLESLSTRQRIKVLREATEIVGDPTRRSTEPATWGSRVQLIYDLFAIYGWQGTGGQTSVAHNLGSRKIEVLRSCYEQWVTMLQQ